MQKDFHFYVTYALAIKAGYSAGNAATIAWANEYTDRQKDEDIYEIQTQCPKLDRWDDPQIQLTVLVPFHFMPGDDEEWPWKTMENSPRMQELVEARCPAAKRLPKGVAYCDDNCVHGESSTALCRIGGNLRFGMPQLVLLQR